MAKIQKIIDTETFPSVKISHRQKMFVSQHKVDGYERDIG